MLTRIVEKLLGARLLTWAAALLVFMVLASLSTAVHSTIADYAFPAFAALAALAILWAGRRFRNRRGAPVPEARASTQGRFRFVLVLVVLAALVSGWQSLAAPPHRIIDTWEYFIGSDQLLGYAHTYVSPESPGYFQDSIITYAYPLFIALVRLVGGHVALLILLQHLLRIGAVVAVYLVMSEFDVKLARVTGVLLAISPLTANSAHLMLTEGLYAPLALGLALIAMLAAKKGSVRWLILLGIAAALIAWIRPVGSYLIIPLAVLLFFMTRTWRKAAWVLISFAVSLLLVSAGRYLIDRNFTFQTTSEGVYYYSILVFHDLFDARNGPVTKAFADVSDNCPMSMSTLIELYPADTRAHNLERILHSQAVLDCVGRADPQLASRQTAMLLEAARAKPLQFLQSVADETMYFISQMELNILWQNTSAPICDKAYALAAFPYDGGTPERFQDFACGTNVAANGSENSVVQTIFANFNVLFLLISQPYLLLNLFYSNTAITFAGACTLVGFIWIEGSRHWRLLLAFLVTLIGYHAFISGVFYTIPRYVMVLNGLFVVIAGMAYVITFSQLAASVRRLAERQGRTPQPSSEPR